ncbi:hypothetical protein I5U60_05005 [Stenotrophomonas maltophilia]|nr:hypothetical protein [Stenotrophomonas maltophilia]
MSTWIVRIGLCLPVFLLAACSNDSAASREPAAEAAKPSAQAPTPSTTPDTQCDPEHLRSLPEGKARDALVEHCMTRGTYKRTQPQTF